MPSSSRAATISLSLLTGLATAGDQHGDENSQRGSAVSAGSAALGDSRTRDR